MPGEDAFERITRLTTQVLGVPFAAVNLLDADRQWSKACVGAERGDIPRADSVCAWTILTPEVLVVPDARQDPRFVAHPLVQSGEVVLYAGAPLLTPDGHALGTLCVTDDHPRPFGEEQVETLRLLARLVMGELELRLRTQELTRARDQARDLRDLAELMNEPLEPRDMACRALSLLHERMRLDWSALLDFTPHGPRVLSAHTSDPASDPERSRAFAATFEERLTLEDSPLAAALSGQGRVFLDDDLAHDPFPHLRDAGLRSVAWLPLQVGRPGARRDPHSLLLLARLGEPAPWTPEERALLEEAARTVGVALERAEHVQMLENAALTDALTGLGNRRALDEALDEADRRLAGQHLGYVLGVVDLDGMKRVNDERGHASGDDLLREFAGQLGAPGLTAYRLGGDEYALLDLWPADPGEAVRAMRARVEEAERHVQALGYPVTASLGVVVVPHEAPGATAALRTADVRMYAHKRERQAVRPLP